MANENIYWLGFSAFPGIGPLRFKLLFNFFGTAEKAWKASYNSLIQIGLGEKLTTKFISFRNSFSLSDYSRKLQENNIHVLTLKDQGYPKLLKEIQDAPFVLYVRGDVKEDIFINPTIAVVGTRKITGYGKEVTERLVRELVNAGFTIVSGLAYGVDTVAHETAVSLNGKTIAVLGCGVNVIHPKSNTTLYWKIVKKSGIIVSEFPLNHWVEKGLFPARNRIISGLSLGVVVTEGAKDSGALITARFAGEQGREVFAVPGPITSSLSEGPTMLLKNGAKLVTRVEDILEELDVKCKMQNTKIKMTMQNVKINLTSDEKNILALLENENLHFDEIARKGNISSSNLGGLLTMMEMKKLVKNLGGGLYGISYTPYLTLREWNSFAHRDN
ncbi:DNA-protecting protein DprA [Candidatus Gottesmanbacteria bacterium CG11_big_fil_rev_8_21_14_0_20_37_11]|uniref:DNA-protecting protein DprA n=2 Tax=Candidatus Gottesmaniibacteriota TaxID=1752720 RepID=A0A2M7RRU6_9BACT|nr:MAG: DNA-protecting protein DprA [Candidatus Gottesmanbacteria bacterium CG11_big_fil_rev_8_21_14_0_20_37_11]PIZ03012.1 MAG: DNA-protecting protein DprA [Candidatus Gottesmanbacteria bacterium CG_4_10_14_0_8_um_filter_37_24]